MGAAQVNITWGEPTVPMQDAGTGLWLLGYWVTYLFSSWGRRKFLDLEFRNRCEVFDIAGEQRQLMFERCGGARASVNISTFFLRVVALE